MPLNITSVFSFIPTNIWRPLKKFVTKDNTIVFDIPFKMSTKYTPALCIVMMCLSFANQFVRNVEMDCSAQATEGGGGNRRGYSNGDESELTDFCWNYETFLVVKALEPNMRGRVTYPGVSGYKRDVDEILVQRYYKYVWLILGKLVVISFLPYLFWKVWATKKIKPLVVVTGTEEFTEEERRVSYFLETIGFNDTFAWYYFACKISATITPLGQWYYLCGFIGKRYKYYGVDVIVNFMDESAPWPNPMDALFPKVAKCEFSRYGFGGDMEVRSAQCQLPMNNITQWSFFVYWWWLAIIFLVNLVSVFILIFFTFPNCRRYHYLKFVAAACREDVEKARNILAANAQIFTKKLKRRKKDVINVKLSFGDWLVLYFIRSNLPDWQFRDFIRKMATTQNSSLQLTQIAILPSCPPMEEGTGDGGGDYGWNIEGMNGGGHKAANMDIAFNQRPAIPHNSSLPSYSACEKVSSTDCDPIESSSTLSTETETCLPATSTKIPQYSANISKPVKIDRSNSNTNTKKATNTKKEKNDPTPKKYNKVYNKKAPKETYTKSYNDYDLEEWD